MTKILRKDSSLKPADAAKLVESTVPDVDGKTAKRAIRAGDVFDWCEYPDEERIVVITVSGEKLEGKLPPAKK